MAKEIKHRDDVRRAMTNGIDLLADTVKTTLGPKGRDAALWRRNAVQRQVRSPLVTNDGVTIAKEIASEDPFEQLGIQLVQETSAKANALVGDGTTTATLLAQAIIHEGVRNIAAGADPVGFRKGVEKAVSAAACAIDEQARKLNGPDEIAHIATISSGDPEVGRMLSDIMTKITVDGVVTIEESKTTETTYRIALGMQFERGYISPHMVTDREKMVAVAENAHILVTDWQITSAQEILPLLELFANTEKRLVIIADEVSGEALNVICHNCNMGVLHALCVRAPAYGDGRVECLKDIATVTGATFVSKERDMRLRDVDMMMLGRARRVESNFKTTIISGGGGRPQEIKDRVSLIRNQLELSNFEFDRKRFRDRLAHILSGVAVIRVGAATEIEMQEKKYRIEDAMNATRAAMEEGIVPGGGTIFLNVIPAVEALCQTLEGDELSGARGVMRALEAPVRQIAMNAGYDNSVVVQKVRQSDIPGYGFDAYRGEYCDLMENSIIDPAKVSRVALESAASIAAVVLTCDAMVVEKRPEVAS